MENNKKLTRYKFHVVIAILLIIHCISMAPKGLQNDTFYTIKVGEYIAQNGIGNLTKPTKLSLSMVPIKILLLLQATTEAIINSAHINFPQ